MLKGETRLKGEDAGNSSWNNKKNENKKIMMTEKEEKKNRWKKEMEEEALSGWRREARQGICIKKKKPNNAIG